MAKKAVAKAVVPEAKKRGAKSAVYRDWWNGQAQGKTSKDLPFKEHKDTFKQLVEAAGETFDENSDYQAWLTVAKQLGRYESARGGASKEAPNQKHLALAGMSFGQFIQTLTTDGVDSATLTAAIKLVGQVGSVQIAEQYATRWSEMVAKLGEKNAKAAAEFIP